VSAKLSCDISHRFPKGGQLSVCFSGLEAPPGITVLLGPSGSGKSTLLHCLAGIEQPESGFIRHGESLWFDAKKRIHFPPQKRPLTLLFQNYPLFPHLSVLNNILYGLNDASNENKRKQAMAWLERLHLQGKGKHSPAQLSGGEQQRVALAQVMAPGPQVLLLDEPFSAVDQTLRIQLRGALRDWIKEAGSTAIIVTHQLSEALALGDELIVLSSGKILQQGQPMEIFKRPAQAEVAKIVGFENLLPGRVIWEEKGLIRLDIGKTSVLGSGSGALGQSCFAAIRSEEVLLEKCPSKTSSARNHLPATIQSLRPCGFYVDVLVDCGILLKARITAQSVQTLDLRPGDRITAVMKASAVQIFPALESAAGK